MKLSKKDVKTMEYYWHSVGARMEALEEDEFETEPAPVEFEKLMRKIFRHFGSRKKRRYVIELTEKQVGHLFSALEVYEDDATGGYGFDSREKRYRRLHRNTYNALIEGYDNGMKSVSILKTKN